jgi:hypothetical protein
MTVFGRAWGGGLAGALRSVSVCYLDTLRWRDGRKRLEMTTTESDTGPALWRRAQDWTVKLFQALGYSVTRDVQVKGFQIDLIVRKDDLSHPVEIKVRRSGALKMNDLAEQAVRLRAVTDSSELVASILVVFGKISTQALNWSQNEYNLRLWDFDVLREKSQPFPALQREFDRISAGYPALPTLNPATESESERLIERLEGHLQQNTLTPSGYEALCQEVFVHLFDPDLYGFQQQSETTDGGNRYDFICRIKSGSAF